MLNLPFSQAEFFQVFARYNEAVWPAQVGLRTLALLVIPLLFVNRRAVDRAILGVLAFLWLWMAVAYHFWFFARINPAAWGFGALFLIEAAYLFWLGPVRGRVAFQVPRNWRGLAGACLLAFALLFYPAVSYFRGDHYPAVPSFGLPCPTTIFTLGMLVMIRPPIPWSLFVIPLLWTVVGSSAALHLGVVQDLALAVAGLTALAVLVASRVKS